MGPHIMYLIDSNIIIYFLSSTTPPDVIENIKKVLSSPFSISIITKIEVLGWKKHSENSFKITKELFRYGGVIPVYNNIAGEAINLKRGSSIKLPDAIIASTAIISNLILVTRNVNDFKFVKGIKILNPFEEVINS